MNTLTCLAVVLAFTVGSALAQTEAREPDSARQMLRKCQEALNSRGNVFARFESSERWEPSTTIPSDVVVQRMEGTIALYNGKFRQERTTKSFDASGLLLDEWHVISRFDSRQARALRINGAEKRGYIDPAPRQFAMQTGIWLLNGVLEARPQQRVESDGFSVFEFLLTQLQNAAECSVHNAEIDGFETVVIRTVFANEDEYTLWIDPKRDYCLVKLQVKIGPSATYNTSHTEYSTDIIQLAKVDGKWLPTQVTLRTMTQFGSGSLSPQTRFVGVLRSTAVIKLQDHRILREPPPADWFELRWPFGTPVRDRVGGPDFVQGSLGASFEEMVPTTRSER